MGITGYDTHYRNKVYSFYNENLSILFLYLNDRQYNFI